MEKATVREIGDIIKGKRVFLRSDLNVPFAKDGSIDDDKRIVASLPTLQYLLDKGARVIICSHLGRPKGKDKNLSLKPVFKRLQELLSGRKVYFDKEPEEKLKDGEVLLLENIRFFEEETKNDIAFAKKLSAMADYYVNDAFGAAHRAHASTEGIARFIPAVSGFLMEQELKILGEAINNPRKPLLVIIGGKKVDTKIGVFNGLLDIAQTILVGGGMTYTFVKANGGSIGNSILDVPSLEFCKQVQLSAKKKGVQIVLPQDSVCADRLSNDAHIKIFPSDQIADGWEGFDIGPKTIEEFKKHIARAGTVIWVGPVGVSEVEAFANGTKEIAQAVVDSGAVSIIGGGDSASAITRMGMQELYTHISTGGGASLEFLEGKKLPGVEALIGKEVRIK